MCVVKFGKKTYVPIFKFVARVNREFIWELLFCLCKIFFLLSDKTRCAFCLCLKSIRCVLSMRLVYPFDKLILKILDDENNLHRGYVVVDCKILIL